MTRHNAKFPAQPRGADSYDNHSVCHGGWTYQGRTLGNSFLTAARLTLGFDDSIPGITNNIVVAQHASLDGHLGAGLLQAPGHLQPQLWRTGRLPDLRLHQSGRRADRSAGPVVVPSRHTRPLSRPGNLHFRVTATLDTGEFCDVWVGGSLSLLWRGPPGR